MGGDSPHRSVETAAPARQPEAPAPRQADAEEVFGPPAVPFDEVGMLRLQGLAGNDSVTALMTSAEPPLTGRRAPPQPGPPAATRPALSPRATGPPSGSGGAGELGPDGEMAGETAGLRPGNGAGVSAYPESEPDPLSRWRSSVASAAEAIPAPDLAAVTASPAALRGRAGEVDAARRARRPDFAAEATARVPPAPAEPPREQTLDTTAADAAVRAVRQAASAKLRDQTFPAPRPMPSFGGGGGPGGAPAGMAPAAAPTPAAAPALGPVAGDAKADEMTGRVAAVTAPTATPKPAEAVTLRDRGAASLTPPPPAQAAAIGDVLARVRADVPRYAQEFVTAGAGRLDPGSQVPALTTMAGDVAAAQRTDIAAEIDGVAAAAGVSAQALAAKVAARQETAARDGATAAAHLESAGTAARSGVAARGEEETRAIAGARAAADEFVARREAAAAGSPDPAVIDGIRDGYLSTVESTAAAAAAVLRASGETRASELGRVAAEQKAAYRRQGQAEAGRIRGQHAGDDDAGRIAARPALNWAEERCAEVDATLARLTGQASTEVSGLQAALTAAATRGRDQIRDWAASRQGRQRSWWERLLDTVRDWAGKTRADTRAWQAQRDAQTRDAITGDLDLLMRMRDQLAAGNTEAVSAQLSRLSAAQRAVVTQFLRSGGRDPIGAVATGLIARLRERRVPEIAKTLEQRAVAELGWEDLNALGRAQSPGFDAGVIVRDLRGAVKGWGTDEGRLFRALEGRTPIQVAALRKAYAATYPGRDLDSDLDDDVDGAEQERAEALLSGDPTTAAVATLHDAMSGVGTDEATIMQTLRGKTPAERDAIVAAYRDRYGVDLLARLADDLSGNQLGQAQALLSGDVARADAYALDEAMSGWGTDETAIHGVYSRVRDEVEAQARTKGMTSAEVEAEIRRRTSAIRDAYGGARLDAAFADELSGGELNLARAEQAYDQTAIDAARIQVEHESFYTSDDAVNAVLRDQHARARRDVLRDLEVRFNSDPAHATLSPAERAAALDRLRASATDQIAARARQNMADLEARYDADNPQWGPGGFQSVIELELSGYAYSEARDLIRQGGKLSDAQELRYAIYGEGTNEEAIRRTLQGKSRAEIEELARQYRELTGGDLRADLDGELSGRDWADTRAQMFGTKTPEELLAYQRERARWELAEGTGVLGDLFDEESAAVLSATVSQAGDAYAEYVRLRDLHGADDPRTVAARERFERWAGYGDKDVEEHRAAVDTATDTLATIAAVAAGVAVTVVSGGAAAPVVAAAASALGTSTVVVTGVAAAVAATAAGIATRALAKGDAYGAETLAQDLVQGAVEGIVAAATAGVGAKALDALMKSPAFAALREAAEGGVLSRLAAAGFENGLEGAIGGLPSGMASAILNDTTWMSADPLGVILKSGAAAVGTGAGVGALAGAAGEALAGGGRAGAGDKPAAPLPEPAAPAPAGPGGPDGPGPVPPRPGANRPVASVDPTDNSIRVKIDGEIGDPAPRGGLENAYEPGSAFGLPDYQRAHAWGPGFGDEVADGMMLVHRNVNLKLQNRGVEDAIRRLHQIAEEHGGALLVSVIVTSHPRTPGGPLLLKTASYRISLRSADGRVMPAIEVDIGEIGVPGTPSSTDPPVSIGLRGDVQHSEIAELLRPND
jgi:hypothetical protein